MQRINPTIGIYDSRVIVLFRYSYIHNMPAILLTSSFVRKHKTMNVFHFLIKIFIYLAFRSANTSWGRARAKRKFRAPCSKSRKDVLLRKGTQTVSSFFHGLSLDFLWCFSFVIWCHFKHRNIQILNY